MEYEKVRQRYKPERIKVLLVAESPPPDDFAGGSRHFYRSEPGVDDRLFVNTIKALYPETMDQTEEQIEKEKEQWLQRFKSDGFYMTETLEKSLAHAVKKPERRKLIQEALPRLIERLKELCDSDTRIILIKSNPFDIAAEPLREAGFNVLNQALVDYPGHYNQEAYRKKLTALIKK